VAAADELIIVGRVRKPQGLHGEVLVEPITDSPDAVFASGVRLSLGTTEGDPAADGIELEPVRARPFKDGYLVRFRGIETRDQIELWRGRFLLASAEAITPPAPDEVYLHELVGMRVTDEVIGDIGEVIEVYELPQGPALEVKRRNTTVLVPYLPEIVREVDVDARVVRIAAPAGLFD
jgi:16S rRNA processing protein RimM